MKKYLLHIVLFFCITQQLYSQEDGVVAFKVPARNSLKFSRHFINPTFSFVREQNKYISLNNKREWVQFDDAPQTYSLGYSGRFRENIGAGVTLFQQNYGVLTTFGGVANFAYNAVLDRDSNLTFGTNLAFYKSGINEGNVITNFPDSSLDNFPSNSIITINPGINYGTEFLDFGISINNLVAYNLTSSKMIEDNPEQGVQGHIMYTGYLNSRGFFDESRFSGLISSEFRKDETVISGMVMLMVPKGIWVQAGYNSLYALSAGIGLNISPQIAFEYNYEKGVGGFSTFGNSHDITLAYKFENRNRYDYSGDDEEEALLMSSRNKKRTVAKKRKPSKSTSRKKVKPEVVKNNDVNSDKVEIIDKTTEEEQTKLAEAARIKEAQEEQARIAEAARVKAEADAQTKLAEAARIKEAQEEQARIAEAARVKAEADAQTKLAEEARIKEAQKEQAKIAEAARVKAEADAQTKLAEEARIKEAQKEQARIVEAARVKAAADAQTKLAEEARVKEAQEAQARIAEAARVKAEADAQAIIIEANRIKIEQEEQARVVEVARIKAEKEAQIDEILLDEVLIEFKKSAEASKNAEQELLNKLSEKVANKQQDLNDLKEENDLSEKGIVSAPKAFKSVSVENAIIEGLNLKIDNSIELRNAKITEIEALYKARIKKVRSKDDAVNKEYLNTIQALKAEQQQAQNSKQKLMSSLNDIKVATDFERSRRIKRAAYDNEDDRYNKDRAVLERIKKFTDPSTEPLTVDDFDHGEELSNIQIVKGVNNVQGGYYLVVAVHNSVTKRDEFLKKAVAAGEKNINFFFDVNTNKYYIYYEKFDNIGGAKNSLDANKGSKPYNRKMSMVKIEN